jgi:drug/metabolite transporter (DMT)-like permease
MIPLDRSKVTQGYLFVLLAGSLWATLGLFFRYLDQTRISPEVFALCRSASSAIFLFCFLLLQPSGLKRIARRDIIYFLFFGVCIAAFFIIYIRAIQVGSVALAVILLYTCPIWVTIFARIRWGEVLYPEKMIALFLSIGGCALVASASSDLQGGFLAMLLGLGSGLAYAFYSLLSNEGMKRGYPATTMMCYALFLGSIFLLPFQNIEGWVGLWNAKGIWPLLGGMAIVSMLAPLFYAVGQKRIGASKASIAATIEPVIASALAWLLLGETLKSIQLVGGILVLAAVVVLARTERKTPSA